MSVIGDPIAKSAELIQATDLKTRSIAPMSDVEKGLENGVSPEIKMVDTTAKIVRGIRMSSKYPFSQSTT